MIRQQFLYDDNAILSIYHRSFDDFPKYRLIQDNIYISDKKLEFIECYIDDDDIEIDYDSELIEGFLECENPKNPYTEWCCNYEEFINFSKPFFCKGKLIINEEELIKIANFIKKQTNFDLLKNPYSIGNILFYEPIKIEANIRLDKSNNGIDLDLAGIELDDMIITTFKHNNCLVNTQVFKGNRNKITINKNWDSFDFAVFRDGNIIYLNRDIVFIETVVSNMNTISKQSSIELKTQKKKIKVHQVSSLQSKVGKMDTTQLKKYLREENILKNELQKINNLGKVNFLGKNETDTAFNIFKGIAQNIEYEELWIFDPYFVNYNITGGKDKLRDILKIMLCNHSIKKNIVFECNKNSTDEERTYEEKQDDFEKFLLEIEDEDIRKYRKEYGNLNVHFYGTIEHFHDRFIVLKSQDKIKGYAIGTSLNSFGENYSTIIELEAYDIKMIFNKLIDEVCNNKIEVDKQI